MHLDQQVDFAFLSIAKDIVGGLKINPEHYGSEAGPLKIKEEKRKEPQSCCLACLTVSSYSSFSRPFSTSTLHLPSLCSTSLQFNYVLKISHNFVLNSS